MGTNETTPLKYTVKRYFYPKNEEEPSTTTSQPQSQQPHNLYQLDQELGINFKKLLSPQHGVPITAEHTGFLPTNR